ncbi:MULTISPECIES: hypothetical protein [Staphylococcus]|mgnify:CR=1 FL=1|uniref:ORF069 n=1 Tax=Staphylococcus phage 37 TaxID=2936813 RepID=Q4ZCB8_9CAUD|nr:MULTISPECIES: hypothetical protein [Staphylococcus]YP_240108.1 ORF069 [Staphylococcus phage 37]AAX91320.1 ORF069 [Staphylococcus phage 37]MBO0387584.1 hypothetical protein [Staphylococcus simulans]OHR08536.1 hypothetical protein HMPREF2721_00350 [Staphylococcus sp. HMSC078A12]PTJ92106.1 hypothetical protein BU032_03520 [Staphylococcus simulans]RIN81092.1 hypothetical protein BU016_06310 [Staphylococcus simulans]
MEFKNWKVNLNGKGSYNIVTNEDTLLVLQNYQHVEIALKFENENIQVKSLGYGQNLNINPVTKEITINVTDLLEDDE